MRLFSNTQIRALNLLVAQDCPFLAPGLQLHYRFHISLMPHSLCYPGLTRFIHNFPNASCLLLRETFISWITSFLHLLGRSFSSLSLHLALPTISDCEDCRVFTIRPRLHIIVPHLAITPSFSHDTSPRLLPSLNGFESFCPHRISRLYGLR